MGFDAITIKIDGSWTIFINFVNNSVQISRCEFVIKSRSEYITVDRNTLDLINADNKLTYISSYKISRRTAVVIYPLPIKQGAKFKENSEM